MQPKPTGQMWGDCQGQKWTAPQGMHGKYLVSLSHMVAATKKKTQTSKPDISSVKKNGLDPISAGQNSLLSPGESVFASQEKDEPLFNGCGLDVNWMLIFFFRGCQRTVVFQSVPSSITYVLSQTLATAKTKREKFIWGVSEACDIQFV